MKAYYLNFTTGCLISILSCFTLNGQQKGLYEFREFQDAVKSDTRTRTGVAGNKYWQNSSDYTIEASVDTATNTLKGFETIYYHNNSSDSLKNLCIRIYQDLYKKENPRLLAVPAEDLTDGVFIDSLKINGLNYIVNNISTEKINRISTILYIRLKNLLKSDSTARIEIAWKFRIPATEGNEIGRMGRYGNAFFMGLWYPQISVYDDIRGWDIIPHLGVLEFYNDFNNYDVTLKVPEGYVVWGTGSCDNLNEVLHESIVERLDKARSADSVVKIITKSDYSAGITKGNTWHFKAGHVPDFAFAMATDYLWEGSSIEVDHDTKRRVLIDVLHPAEVASDFNSVAVTRDAVAWTSDSFPGVPFPYEHATVFVNTAMNGSSMEFPMMVNNSNYTFAYLFNSVAAHEVYHNYMPFYMGFNETSYMWMDEGFTQLNEHKFKGDKMSMQTMSIIQYPSEAGKMDDHPLMDFSVDYHMQYLSFLSYFKPCSNLMILEALLGPEVFKSATQEFMKNWNGKHPTPYDMFYSYNRFSKSDLTWFWKACYFEPGYADLSIKEINKNNIVIERKGSIPVPVYVEITYIDGARDKVFRKPDVWIDGQTLNLVPLRKGKTIKEVRLGNLTTPDINPNDNVLKPVAKS